MSKVTEISPGVYKINGRFATENLIPGRKVYGEELVKIGGVEYRIWDIYRSKLAAALAKGLKSLEIRPGSRVLYLGASSGTTASHVSDIVGGKGKVFCVEFAHRPMLDLLKLCELRKNMLPFLADARLPETYASIGKVDVAYQDVAQPDQERILIVNADKFLKKGDAAYIAIKSQSIDVAKKPETVYAESIRLLSARFDILEQYQLDPFDVHHLFVACRMK